MYTVVISSSREVLVIYAKLLKRRMSGRAGRSDGVGLVGLWGCNCEMESWGKFHLQGKLIYAKDYSGGDGDGWCGKYVGDGAAMHRIIFSRS